MSQDKAQAQKIKPSQAPRYEKRQKRSPKKITAKYLHNAGLGYLGRFAASSHHFRSVMMRKIDRSCQFHTDQSRDDCVVMLNELIAKFQRSGLLDDHAYARGMVHSLHRRGLSGKAITFKLKAKGLAPDVTQEAIEQLRQEHGDNTDLQAAVILMRKRRMGPFNQKEDPKLQEKSLATLARAGFSYDLAQSVLKMEKSEAEETLYNAS